MNQTWIERAARAGYLAKGIVYAVIGLLAFRAAFWTGGETTGSRGAIEAIGEQPLGRAFLLVLLIGLIGYVVWRLIQVFLDPDERGSDKQGLVVRGMLFLSALVYAGLAYTAARLLVGAGGKAGGDHAKQALVATLLEQPLGRLLVAVVALLIVIKAGAEFRKAYGAKFEEKWKTESMSSSERRWMTTLSRIGVSARGLVFLIIAGFFATAALQRDASEVKGTPGALHEVALQPFGMWLLGAMGLGLTCYAIYQGAQALYRRIPADSKGS